MNELDEHDLMIANIRTVLSRLMMEPDRQLAYLRQSGFEVDELALEFDDVALSRDLLLHEGVLTSDQFKSLSAIANQFSAMTKAGPVRWTEEAVALGEDWQQVRRLARLALAKLKNQ